MTSRILILSLITLIITSCDISGVRHSPRNNSQAVTKRLAAQASEMTSLPFGPKGWPQSKDSTFYDRLIGTNLWGNSPHYAPLYNLPEIRSIKYISINLEPDSCDNQPFNQLLKLTKYRFRLPDYGVYQCYYINDGRPAKENYCLNTYSAFGLLVLYNPKTMQALVFDILHSYYVDSDHYRSFYIDRNFTVHLFDQQATDGGVDWRGITDITISKTGKFQIQTKPYNPVEIK